MNGEADAAVADVVDASAPPSQTAEWSLHPSAVDFEDPLLAALSKLIRTHGQAVSVAALRAALPAADGHVTPEMAVVAAEAAGFSAKVVHRRRLRDISAAVLPCILLLRGRNVCVLRGVREGELLEVEFPESGLQILSTAELGKEYLGYGIFVAPRLQFDKRAPDIGYHASADWFWGTLSKFWTVYSHVIVASIFINLFALATPLFMRVVYDRIIPHQAFDTLWVLGLGITTVVVFEFILRNLRSYFVDSAGKNADVIMASKLLRHVLSMRLDKRSMSTGSLVHNLREFESLRDFFTSGTIVAFIDLPFVVLFIAIIYLTAGSPAYIPAVAVPLVIVVGVILQFPLRKVVESTHRHSSQKQAIMIEAIEGLEAVKINSAESAVQAKWEQSSKATSDSSLRSRIITSMATNFAQLVTQFCTVAVIVYGVVLIQAGELTMGGLIAVTILTGRALAPLGAVAALVTRFQQSRVALKSLYVLMRTPVERPAERNFVSRTRFKGEIQLRNVVFRYPSQSSTGALNGLSLHIKPGEHVGIIGRIGSGKTTLSRLLLGLYEPQEGAVLMDGVDIRQMDPADVRRNVGHLSQDIYLTFGSVRDNILFGAPDLDDTALLRAAEIAGVSEFVRRHPEGFDMQVGERGSQLSGGQRQAVALARAVLLDPPILVLDEPTSNMDNATERRIRDALTAVIADRTAIIMTHRSSLLALVDRLIVLDGGRVVADGTKEAVLEALRRGEIRSPDAAV